MVHLESRNIDREHKRIEIGYKGEFACVKPCCFTIVSIRLFNVMQNSSPFLDANLSVLLEGEFYSVAGEKKIKNGLLRFLFLLLISILLW